MKFVMIVCCTLAKGLRIISNPWPVCTKVSWLTRDWTEFNTTLPLNRLQKRLDSHVTYVPLIYARFTRSVCTESSSMGVQLETKRPLPRVNQSPY